MKPLKKYAILLKMSKNEGHNTGSFIKKACSMMMDGMMIPIMVPSLLTMLLPWQLPMYDGHSDPKQFLMSYEATISSYGGNAAVMAKSFIMAVKNVAQTWYSSLRPGTHFMAEAQRHAGYKLPGLPDEASHSSGSVSMHARSRGVSPGIGPKVLASEGTSAYSAQ
jgi:hypothetical protein